jgi:hypothetical protein
MKLGLGLVALLFSLNSTAALSPYWDSVNQIGVAMSSSELSEKVSGKIVLVKNLGELMIEVNTEFCRATVELNAHIPTHPGPTTYTVKSISNVDCE